MLLLIDNYDSFTYNLVHFLGELGEETLVYRNDELEVEEAIKMNPDIFKRLERAVKNANILSQWENGFVESLMEQFNKHGRLSPRQVEVLESE